MLLTPVVSQKSVIYYIYQKQRSIDIWRCRTGNKHLQTCSCFLYLQSQQVTARNVPSGQWTDAISMKISAEKVQYLDKFTTRKVQDDNTQLLAKLPDSLVWMLDNIYDGLLSAFCLQTRQKKLALQLTLILRYSIATISLIGFTCLWNIMSCIGQSRCRQMGRFILRSIISGLALQLLH